MSDEKRTLPQTELDLALMTTNSVWGNKEVSQELRTKLNRLYKGVDEAGNETSIAQSEWGNLGFFTRDIRLGNLDRVSGELQHVRHFLRLANDCLQLGLKSSFVISLSEVATYTETSQSKGGFLRKIMNTIRQETTHRELEPPKKKFFGGNKKEV